MATPSAPVATVNRSSQSSGVTNMPRPLLPETTGATRMPAIGRPSGSRTVRVLLNGAARVSRTGGKAPVPASSIRLDADRPAGTVGPDRPRGHGFHQPFRVDHETKGPLSVGHRLRQREDRSIPAPRSREHHLNAGHRLSGRVNHDARDGQGNPRVPARLEGPSLFGSRHVVGRSPARESPAAFAECPITPDPAAIGPANRIAAVTIINLAFVMDLTILSSNTWPAALKVQARA